MSSIYANEAVVSSVYFDAASTATNGLVAQGTAVNERGETIATLDASGVLRWMPSQCGSVMIANLETVRGLQPINALGNDMLAADIDGAEQPATARRLAMLMLHAPPGGSFTVTHQDAGVAAHQKITTTYGFDVVCGADRIQAFSETRGLVRLWRVPDWAGYLPAAPDNWAAAPARLSSSSAYDRLAARVTAPFMVALGPCSLDAGGQAHLKYYGPTAVIDEITGVVNTSLMMVASSVLTPSINGVPITDGAVVFNSNYSPGDTESASPTAANVIADGDMLSVAQSGANMLAGNATLYLRLRAKP